MIKTYLLLLCGILLSTSIFTQGIKNNGATIVIKENSHLIINGIQGNFTNQSSGAFHGSVDLDGTMSVDGSWANHATSGGVFVNQNNLGTVIFGGGLVKHTVVASGYTTQFEHVMVVAGNELDIPAGAVADVSYSLINDGVLNVDGDLYLQGTIVNNGTITGSGVIHYNGNSPQEIIPGTFSQIELDNPSGADLLGGLDIDTKLILTNGVITIGDFDLSLAAAAVVDENVAVSWVNATGNGLFKKAFAAAEPFNFPVGNAGVSPAYSPVELNLTSGIFNSAWVGVNLKNQIHPDNTRGPNALNRYWVLHSGGLSNFTYDANFYYVDGDVTGTDTEIDGARLESAPPPVWRRLGPANAAGNYIEATGQTEFSAFTGVEYFKPPSVTIVNPADGSSVYDYPLQVTGTASDADMDLTDVYVSLNGGPWESATGTYNWTKDVNLVIGTNSIRVRAKDIQDLDSPIVEHHVILSIQIIPLIPGWSAISAFLTPNDPLLELVMQDVGIPGNLTIMLGGLGIYWPAHNSNTIGNWNVYEGYKVKHTVADQLIIRGDKVNNKNVLYTAGFHYIAVLSNELSPISQIFTDPENDVKYLFDLTSGKVYWPEGGITDDLLELVPGRGYLSFFNNDVSIDFPDYDGLKSSIINAPLAEFSGPWEYDRTGNVHLVSIDNDAAAALKDVSHIGAFDTNGQCIGSAELNHSKGNFLLTLFGDDETTTEKDGALEDEDILFKAYDPVKNLEFEITPVFSEAFPNITSNYNSNGMSGIISFKESSTGVAINNGQNNSIELFPNPATDQVMLICPDYSDKNDIDAKIVNNNGRLMKQISITQKETKIDVSSLPTGVYIVKISGSNNVVYKKLIVR